MAPTKDVVITIPTLEGIVAALLQFHRSVVDSIPEGYYSIIIGCALIMSSFYMVQESYKGVINPSPDLQQLQPEDVEEDAAPSYHSYGAIEASDRVKTTNRSGREEAAFGCFWRALSWVLFFGGIFIMIPTD